MASLSLLAAKVIVLALGIAISAIAFLSYRRTRDRLMLYLSVAFVFVAIGSFAEGVLLEVLEWDLITVHTIESAFLLAGLAVIAILLRPREAPG